MKRIKLRELILISCVLASCSPVFADSYTGGYSELLDALNSSSTPSTFTSTSDISVTSGLPSQTPAVLTINGGGFDLNGNSNVGFTAGAGQTLTINNFDEVKVFLATSSGGVVRVNAGGTLTVLNSKFLSNTAPVGSGGVFNNDQGSITIGSSSGSDSSSFIKNSSGTNSGGAIWNNGSLTVNKGVLFAGNYSATSAGGAISNRGSAAILNIDGATFKWNGYSDYDVATDKSLANSVVTTFGGAIYNYAESQALNIKNSTFLNNASASNGGAIYNNSTITNGFVAGSSGSSDTTKFINNSSLGNGGAIYNSGLMSINKGVTFAGNYASISSGGGAIYNGGVSAVANIDGATFKWNGYTDYDTATDKSLAGSISGSSGGAITNTSGAKLTITNSIFSNNAAKSNGAGVRNDSATLTIGTSGTTDTTKFINNYVSNTSGSKDGVVIYNTNAMLIINKGVLFAGNNSVGYGGAIYNTGASSVATIDGATFKWNGYSDYDVAIDKSLANSVTITRGGAILNTSSAKITITNSIFANNATTVSSGAIYNDSTAANALVIGTAGSTDTTKFINNSIQGTGTSKDGGAIWNSGSSLNIYKGVTFAGNYTNSSSSGGAINNTSATAVATIDGAIFKWNGYSDYSEASDKSIGNAVSVGYGGVSQNYNGAQLNITNSTFLNNASVSRGGALYNNSGSSTITIGKAGQTDTTRFINNLATAGTGGAIYNNAILNVNKGVLFAGNYVGSLNYGSAIYNSSASAVATIDGATFKWNGYSDYDAATDKSLANTVSTKGSGALHNTSGAKMTITNSLFSNNAVQSSGGVIYNDSTVANAFVIGTSGSTDTTKFINNSVLESGANKNGGAIFNNGTMDIYKGVTFAGNYTNTSSAGGAIFNTGVPAVLTIDGATFKWNGYSDYDVATDKSVSGTAVSVGSGGAIYNTSGAKLTITNSNFINNTVASGGGAILNAYSASELIVKAINGTTLFSGNKATAGGAIHNGGILSLIADSGMIKFATSTDTVYSTTDININTGDSVSTGVMGSVGFAGNVNANTANILINKSNAYSTLSSGNVTFNAAVSAATISSGGGTLGVNGALTATNLNLANTRLNLGNTGTLSTTNIALDNSVLNLVNSKTDSINVSTLSATNTPTLMVDADLNAGTNDKITTTTSSTGDFNAVVNIKSDVAAGSSTLTLIDGTGVTSNITSSQKAFTNNNTYTFASAGAGQLAVNSVLGGGLNAAIADTTALRSFSATGDVTVVSPLGTMGGAGSTLNIYGNGHSIIGGGVSGVTVSTGQSLNIYGVGDVSGTNSWKGFNSVDGGVVYNSGNLNIDKSVFKSNMASNDGGVVRNSSTGNVLILDSAFINNTSSHQGGALYNLGKITIGLVGSSDTSSFVKNGLSSAGTGKDGGAIFNNGNLIINSGVTFAGNYTSSSNSGGAILNYGSSTSLSVDGATFKWNGYSDYDIATDKSLSNAVSTVTGGAILNSASAKLTISNSTFSNNVAAVAAGAVYNNSDSLATISNSTFDSNTVKSTGAGIVTRAGAIYNAGVGSLEIYDSTFSNNKTSTAADSTYSQGGAIFTGGNLKIVNTKFTSNSVASTGNSSSVSGGAIHNYSTSDKVVQIIDSTFTGNSISTIGTSSNANGGAIMNDKGEMTVLGSTFTSNSASATSSYGFGGAIFNNSTSKLTVVNSTFTDNTATYRGGGIYNLGELAIGTLAGGATKFINNHTVGAGANKDGGAIFNASVLNIYQGITFAGNYANSTSNGGAIYNSGSTAVANIDGATFKWNGYSDYDVATDKSLANAVSNSAGGAITNYGGAKLTITNSTFLNNAVLSTGGAIRNDLAELNIGTSGSTDSTWFINNHTTGTGASKDGGAIYNTGVLNIYKGVTFAGNYTGVGYVAGAIFNAHSANATIDSVTFKWNGYSDYDVATDKSLANVVSTANGGAIFNTSNAKLTITNSTFYNNAATTKGGAIYNDSTATDALVVGTSGSTDTTSFVNNKSTTSHGGAIYNTGVMNIYKGVTFAGNYTGSSSQGGAIYNNGSSAVATINGATFKWNGYSDYDVVTDKSLANAVSTSQGGTIYNTSAAKLTITNSTFSNNAALTQGGAIYNNSTATNSLTIGTSGLTDTTKFVNNSLTNTAGSVDGGAIFNTGALNIYKGVTFAGNYTNSSSSGGAIFNTGSTAVATIDGATFKWNGYSDYDVATDKSLANAVSNYDGGAIYNATGALLTIKNTEFIKNITSNSGGAIYNSSNNMVISGSKFDNNKAGYGGAIFSNSDKVVEITNSSFTGNQANYGGAIYNYPGVVLKISNTEFVNNIATSSDRGGAILVRERGITYLQADGIGKQTLFQGNKSNGVSNAIYLLGLNSTTNSTALYLNAGNSGKILVYDAIKGSDANYNNIYINSTDSTASTSFIDSVTALNNGQVDFAENITGANVYAYGGTTSFGETGSTKTGFYNGVTFNLLGGTQTFNNGVDSAVLNINGSNVKLGASGSIINSNLNLASGTLDLANGKLDTLTISNFSSSNPSTLKFDVDLANFKSDKLIIQGTAAGIINGSVNILSDMTQNGSGTITLLEGSNLSGVTLNNISPTYSTYYQYLFEGKNNGTYDVSMSWTNGLNSAVAVDTFAQRTFSATADTTISSSLGALGKADSTLNIYGNNKNINGAGFAGMTIASGQTVNVSDVAKWSGFIGTSFTNSGNLRVEDSLFSSNTSLGTSGGVISNASTGVLDILNSTFSSNAVTDSAKHGGVIYNEGKASIVDSNFISNKVSSRGGAIYNASTGDLTISATADSKSLFANNSSQTSGAGAIYNAGKLVISGPVVFAGNYVVSSNAGGAIRSEGAGSNTSINGAIFKWNGYSDYDIASDKSLANVVSASNGGALYNYTGSTVAVSNSKFLNNVATSYGGAIYNYNSTKLTIANSDFINNKVMSASSAGGAIRNENSELVIGTAGSTDATRFINNSAQTGGAISNVLSMTINKGALFAGNYTHSASNGGAIRNFSSNASAMIDGATFKWNGYSDYDLATDKSLNNSVVTSYGGAIYNNSDAKLTVTNSIFSNNASLVSGGAIYNDTTKTVVVQDSSFINNKSASGGAIWNKGVLNIIANNSNVVFSSNTDSSGGNDIVLSTSSTLNINANESKVVSFGGGIKSADLNNEININKSGVLLADGATAAGTSGEVILGGKVVNSKVNLYNGTLSLLNDSYLNSNALSLAGGTLNMANNAVGLMNLSSLNLVNGTTTGLKIDANLASSQVDRISASAYSGNGTLSINGINIIADAKSQSTSANFIDKSLLSSVNVVMGTNKAYSPIYAYDLSYDNTSGNINFSGGPSSSGYAGLNPAIASAPVSANIGAYLGQVNVYNEALSRAEVFMSLPSMQRVLIRNANRYAAEGTFDVQQQVFSPLYLPESRGGVWLKQYTSFENVPMSNGPNVSNVGYGALFGVDSQMYRLRRGYDGYVTAYAGYTGSHQNYDNVGVNQNGGVVGLTGTVYRNNYFASLTASVGDSYGQANNAYGVDNFNTLMAGLALKTGYNFEFKEGLYILQPSIFAAYTFANTFDYTTASGVNMHSDPLNAIQVSPGIKFILNAKNGWQPYLGVNMVWNIMDTQKFYANNAELPQMSIAPYVEYGLGLQRKWGDRLTGFGQAMLRGGGRNGIALQFGFRYAIGK